jgi:hypothetical protein
LISTFAASLAPQAAAQSVMDKLKAAAAKAKQEAAGAAPPAGVPPVPGQPPVPGAKPGQPAVAAAGAITGDSGAFTPPAGTKIDPLVVAPPGAIMSNAAVSAFGVHVTINSQSGSRQVVLVDGVAGPKFDKLLRGDERGALFSPDGNHWAYCGAQGNEWVVIKDGQEVMRGPAAPNGATSDQNCELGFTSNSQHLYFSSVQDISSSSSPGRFVWDGKPAPWGIPGNGFSYMVFSPDGNHVAFPWDAPGASIPSQKFVLDYQLASYTSTTFKFSGDGQHLYTTRAVTSSGPKPSTIVEALIDGKVVVRADFVRWFLPPTGAGDLAVAVASKNGVPAATQSLIIAGKVVPGSETQPGGAYNNVVFSPDGKHYAAYAVGGNGHWVFADGKKQQVYSGIGLNSTGEVTYTADSLQLVYLATMNGQVFLVINGEESDPISMPLPLVFSPQGGHELLVSNKGVLLDGKPLPLDPTVTGVSAISFSPDGNHYAFVTQSRVGRTLVVDGVAQAAYAVAGNEALANDGGRAYVWSPDSKHFAYLCRSSNPAANSDMYVCMDSKAVKLSPQTAYGYVTFSADSNHIFWGKVEPLATFRVFVDGKAVYDGKSPYPGGLNSEAWEPQPDGSLRFIAQDQTGLLRIAVTPSPSTSIASVFGAN